MYLNLELNRLRILILILKRALMSHGPVCMCVQGQEGVSTRLMFETVMGQSVSTDLELKNEGSTAIYYSWERLTPTHSHTQHFYFNNTTGTHTHTMRSS